MAFLREARPSDARASVAFSVGPCRPLPPLLAGANKDRVRFIQATQLFLSSERHPLGGAICIAGLIAAGCIPFTPLGVRAHVRALSHTNGRHAATGFMRRCSCGSRGACFQLRSWARRVRTCGESATMAMRRTSQRTLHSRACAARFRDPAVTLRERAWCSLSGARAPRRSGGRNRSRPRSWTLTGASSDCNGIPPVAVPLPPPPPPSAAVSPALVLRARVAPTVVAPPGPAKTEPVVKAKALSVMPVEVGPSAPSATRCAREAPTPS